VRWMSMHWQKRQYMTPWDENGLRVDISKYPGCFLILNDKWMLPPKS